MPLPVAIAGALSGLATSLTALLKFADNQITAYFLVLSLILVDAGIGLTLNYQGVIGQLFTLIINGLGVPIVIYSWEVLILFAVFPIVMFALKQ